MKIKILSANMWLLPPPASLDNQKRINAFVKLAKKLDPDVINFQEVWLKQYAQKIKSALPNYHFTSPKSLFYNKSGLITLTKEKPFSKKFHQFKIKRQYNPFERIARKGFLRVQIKIKDKTISIINAHIYHSRHTATIKLKLGQIKEVLRVARENGPAIIAGDLNTPPNFYKNLIKNFLTEEKNPETYSEKNKYTHMMANAILNKEGVYNPYPDRVLFFPKSSTANIKTATINEPVISDHYPLSAKINL
jgi:endonuclease/exonuclease/phosphatase family metal-dependent hydrolase